MCSESPQVERRKKPISAQSAAQLWGETDYIVEPDCTSVPQWARLPSMPQHSMGPLVASLHRHTHSRLLLDHLGQGLRHACTMLAARSTPQAAAGLAPATPGACARRPALAAPLWLRRAGTGRLATSTRPSRQLRRQAAPAAALSPPTYTRPPPGLPEWLPWTAESPPPGQARCLLALTPQEYDLHPTSRPASKDREPRQARMLTQPCLPLLSS